MAIGYDGEVGQPPLGASGKGDKSGTTVRQAPYHS